MDDDAPVLCNIANVEITGDGVKYGAKTLREGEDYEKYGFDGGAVYFGIGGFTGHRMIQDEAPSEEISVSHESTEANPATGTENALIFVSVTALTAAAAFLSKRR